MKKVVILGGGNGGSISIRALKNNSAISLSAVIAMSDSGSSSGALRAELGVLPPGDILRAILAMSRYDYNLLKRIFYDTRYNGKGKLQGFGIGHLFLGLTEKYNGGIMAAVEILAQALEAVGPVFPVTVESSDLCAELASGEIIIGEHQIDRPTYDRNLVTNRVWLQPTPQIFELAKRAIIDADYIIIGPGSFYTSLIATLLPEGMKEAIRESRAKLIFIAGNAIESNGEVGPKSLSEFVNKLHDYLPRGLDLVISNTAKLNSVQAKYYQAKNWKKTVIDEENIKVPVLAGDFESAAGGLSPEQLEKILGPVLI